MVLWSDAEITKLIEILATSRINDTSSSLLVLVRKAQEQLPPDRRRPLHTLQSLGDLPQRLSLHLAELKKAVQPPLRIPTPEEILASMSTEQLIIHTASRLFTSFVSGQQELALK